MDTSVRDNVRTIWHQLALRNQWQLVGDEEAFLDQALAEGAELSSSVDPAIRLRNAIQRAYSLRLYQGLTNREDRAAYEIWLMFLRLAIRDGDDEATANDLAQEAVTRVLEKLGNLRSPQSLLSWAMMLFRTVRRDLRVKRVETSLTTEAGELAHDPADSGDMAADIESLLAEQEFRSILHDALPNDLERLTVIRCVIFDDDPRDVARDLCLPLHRPRVAKSRAIQRLRGNQRFMAFIRTLAIEPHGLHAVGETGDG